jgi:hypothetical protein
VADPDVDDPDEENSQDVPVLDVSDGSDEFEQIVGDSYEEQVLPARNQRLWQQRWEWKLATKRVWIPRWQTA